MKYDIDKVHQEKSGRRSGKTVDLLMNAIGMLMVTENETVPIIVPKFVWAYHIRQMFIDIIINHFEEEPIIKHPEEFYIKGYSSRIRIFSIEQWNQVAGMGLRTTKILYDY